MEKFLFALENVRNLTLSLVGDLEHHQPAYTRRGAGQTRNIYINTKRDLCMLCLTMIMVMRKLGQLVKYACQSRLATG